MEAAAVAVHQEQIQEVGFLKVLWKQVVAVHQPQEDLMDVVEPKKKGRRKMCYLKTEGIICFSAVDCCLLCFVHQNHKIEAIFNYPATRRLTSLI